MTQRAGYSVAMDRSAALAPMRPTGCGRVGSSSTSGPAVYAFALILLIIVVSALAPLMTPYDRDAIDLGAILAQPSVEHALGTDDLGRDVFTRLIYAGRFSMLVALCAVSLAFVLGILMGAIAGYRGGAADAAVTMTIDLFLSIPVFLVLLVIASAGGGRLWLVPIVIGGTSWMETARIVRSLVMSLKEEGFVEAARSAGAGNARIVVRHMLPQTLPSAIVSATVGFAQAMLVESALSFLGFGVQPPVPTWGNMLQNANVFIREAPVAAFAPGFMIFITCLSFNQVGEGLRRMLAIER
ncbi:MAG: ABC transporter permease [Candidatus Krumholzibacteria bacterium]|nr:ABC transporter permease [Candidatus Krumholzibacteria bacterium]